MDARSTRSRGRTRRLRQGGREDAPLASGAGAHRDRAALRLRRRDADVRCDRPGLRADAGASAATRDPGAEKARAGRSAPSRLTAARRADPERTRSPAGPYGHTCHAAVSIRATCAFPDRLARYAAVSARWKKPSGVSPTASSATPAEASIAKTSAWRSSAFLNRAYT